jgi:hypothetical protein
MGVGVAVFRRDGDLNPVIGLDFGPFVQGDGTYNFETSSSPSKATDTVTVGGFGQIGLNGLGGQNYLRLRAGYVLGNSGIASTTLVGEWLPVYRSVPFLHLGTDTSTPDGLFLFNLSPELMFQYDALDKGPPKYAIFATAREALRIGPQVVLKVAVSPDRILSHDPAWLKMLAQNIVFSLTAHVALFGACLLRGLAIDHLQSEPAFRPVGVLQRR